MCAKIEKASNVKANKVDSEGTKGTAKRVLISKSDGAENFIMRMFEIEPGGHTPLHSHRHEHEVFVLSGGGLFVCNGEEHRIGAENVIFVLGGTEHQFKNTSASLLKFLCLIPAET